MHPILEINRLYKSFGAVRAVQSLSFRVREGKLFAFPGVNGAGRSTALRILCGQLSRDGGSVSICGADPDDEPDRIRRSLGVVFPHSVSDRELSVRDHLTSRAARFPHKKQEDPVA